MQNKKAKFNYELLESYVAGVVLNGPEVKAIRENKFAFNDSYCAIENGELFLKKFHVTIKEADEKTTMRDRKLLITKKEIRKIEKSIKEKGLTIVPTSMFITDTGLIKLGLATARGKKQYDKRETIKKRDLDRQND